jgi:hypothetical protein
MTMIHLTLYVVTQDAFNIKELVKKIMEQLERKTYGIWSLSRNIPVIFKARVRSHVDKRAAGICHLFKAFVTN